ncbi:transcriptional regulator family: Fungal Specific TF [Penicillium angulare]|uniref:Transcriptional regulator family: Fungal Specific TF n=1 Tax=Penicillium angulare TaxID=116970 RepID=A0A9W9KC89_9EURO|nr:transcriptional regulator family: Fungal Specific TF [Penicillium angulare]
MNSQTQRPNRGDRPYRSHVKPACTHCRRRKSRCKVENQSKSCLQCRIHGTDCSFPPEKPRKNAPRKSRRTQEYNSPSDSPVFLADSNLAPPYGLPNSSSERSIIGALPDSVNEDSTANTAPGPTWPEVQASLDAPLSLEAENDNPHILGPTEMDDTHVLADYLSNFPGSRGIRSVQSVGAAGSSMSPIIFTKVQKRPLGIGPDSSPTSQKLEIIEKLIEPCAQQLVDLYFKKVHPCFPLLDETTFRTQYLNAKGRISPALLACLYAHMLSFWRYDFKLSQTRCPDSRFIWNLASETVYSELHLSPGISTITAILLNIGGRPTTSMVGNGVQLGSAVSLCHSMGLNRNPLSWDIPEVEKNLRINVWWSVLIHDRWSSLAYGTPPHIRRSQYDVPLPSKERLCGRGEEQNHYVTFRALAGLTGVLDFCLEYVYSINTHPPTRNLDYELNKWVEDLPIEARKIITRGANLDIPGASNLRLSFLSLRLLLRRVELDRARQETDADNEKLSTSLIEARRSAEEIVTFIQELEEWQLGDFWLPETAFIFSSTVTFLIRCALETEHNSSDFSRSSSLQMASDFLSSLKSHQQKYGWDLADICLAQHIEVVEKLSTVTLSDIALIDPCLEPRQFLMTDMAFMDDIFPSIWDTLQGM